MIRAAYPALMLTVALMGCKKKDVEPEDQVVEVLPPTTVSITDGNSDSLTFTVPPEAVSVTVTIDGESSASYALNSWDDDSGTTLVYSGWNDQEPQLCLSCDNRVASSEGTFAAIAPNNPTAILNPGVHTITVTGFTQDSLFSPPSPLTGDATVSVQAKVTGELPATGVLNLNLYFTGAQGLTAETAPTDATLTEAVDELQNIYSAVGIDIGELTYNDISTDFQVIEEVQGTDSDLMEMFELSNANDNDGLNLFFVDELTSPFGVILGIAGGIPGPPLLQGSNKSGVAIAIRPVQGINSGWETTMAHEIGHFLGLFHTSEQALFGPQVHDPLPDTPENDDEYLMFNTGVGPLLSEWQGQVMRSNPWVSHPEEEEE